MRNLHDIFNCYFSEPKRPIVLATLFSVSGSHVYRPGALLALTEDGTMFGSISAGCLEDDICSHAQSLFKKSSFENVSSKMLSYGSKDISDNVFGLGLGCGGSVRVLLERLPDDRESSHLYHLKNALIHNDQCLSITLWNNSKEQSSRIPQRMLLSNGNCVFESIQNESTLESLLDIIGAQPECSDIRPRIVKCKELNSDALITIHRPRQSLVIYGSGEIANTLQILSEELNWDVTIVESKNALAEFSSAAHSPDAVVLLTHNDSLEFEFLSKALPSCTRYIGVLGSRSRIGRIVAELETNFPDWTDVVWDKLHAPVGLDIGSDSPQEIALSIICEIVAVANRRLGKPLREGVKTLHRRDTELTEYMS